MDAAVPQDVQYIIMLVGLFVVPRVLQRFRLPSAVTCLLLGAVANIGFHAFHNDPTVQLLASLGIVAMFLFAGLEVDFGELRQGAAVILQHLVIQVILLGTVALVVQLAFDLETRPAVLFALALVTPSTGFILDSLGSLGLPAGEQFWVKSKAIAAELVALGVLFVVIQSSHARTLAVSGLTLAAMVLMLPPAFKVFAQRIAPYAPKAEFTFLVIVALICAFITKRLGVYYLVGAFVVGVTAVRLRKELPALTSHQLIHAIELFATFFIPFYFFKAGLHLEQENFTVAAVSTGLVLVLTVVPIKVALVAIHRRVVLAEPLPVGVRIGTSMVPTLVFTIVIAGILQERFGLSAQLFGALMVFTLLNTVIPGIALRIPPPEFDTPQVPPLPGSGNHG